MASPTTNKGFTYAAHAGSVNAWDTQLNADLEQLDINLGGYYPIGVGEAIIGSTFYTSSASIGSTVESVTLASTIAQHLVYRFTGTLTSSLTVVFPTVGSFYVIDNQATGTVALKVNTAAGSSGLTIQQGGVSLIYTTTTASNPVATVGGGQTAGGGARLYTSLGAPAVTATAGSATGDLTDCAWDATNRQFYVCTTTGTSTSALFTQTMARPVPEGYLTLSTDSSAPIISSDYVSKTAVYYTPFMGNWAVLSNGTNVYPYQFSQLALSLTAGAQVADTIYDVFLFNSTAGVIIGTGPAWSNSGGGTGARNVSLTRLNGTWTNSGGTTITNGSTSFTLPDKQGIYIGSLLIDGTAGQITCHRSYGQSRKWGVWNNYNRQQIMLKAGDATATWSPSSVIGYANASSANSLKVFCGLPEPVVEANYDQYAYFNNNTNSQQVYIHGLGWNSTSAMSGLTGRMDIDNDNANPNDIAMNTRSAYLSPPSLGMQQVYAMEKSTSSPAATLVSVSGTESYMLLAARWEG